MGLSAPTFLLPAITRSSQGPQQGTTSCSQPKGGGRGGDENCLLRCDVMNGTVDYETQSFPQCLPRSVEEVGRDLGRTGCWLLTYLAPCPTCCVWPGGSSSRSVPVSYLCCQSSSRRCALSLPTTLPSGRINRAGYFMSPVFCQPEIRSPSLGRHLPHPCPPPCAVWERGQMAPSNVRLKGRLGRAAAGVRACFLRRWVGE